MIPATGSPPTKTNATRERGEGANKNYSEAILHGQHATVNQLPLPAPETVKGRCLGAMLRGREYAAECASVEIERGRS